MTSVSDVLVASCVGSHVASKWPFWERKDLGCCGVSMVGPQLGRETDAIAESAY